MSQNRPPSMNDAEEANPRTAIRQLLDAWHALMAFLAVVVMGIPTKVWREILAGTSTGHRVVFDAIACLISSLAVAAATVVTAYRLLAYTWIGALLLGLFTGLGLFLLDRHMLRLRYQADANDRRFRILIGIVRVSVLLLMFALGLYSAVNANREAIDTELAKLRLAKTEVLAADPRYKAQIDAARKAVEVAANAMARQADLRKALQESIGKREAALQEASDQCEGNTSSDGRTRVAGCGSRARGAKNQAIALERQIDAIDAELRAITPVAGVESATQALARIEKKIGDEAEQTTSGLPARLKIMIDLMSKDWAALVSILPWLILTLMSEFLLWVSYARRVDPALIRINTIQKELLDAELDAYRRTCRDRIGQRSQTLILHLPSGRRPKLKAVSVQAQEN